MEFISLPLTVKVGMFTNIRVGPALSLAFSQTHRLQRGQHAEEGFREAVMVRPFFLHL